MRGIERELRRIINDILKFRNIEAYVIALVGLALVALDVIGDVDPGLQLTVMTAALALLVFRSTRPEQQSVDLDDVLKDRQSYSTFREFIQGGKVMWAYGPSLVNVLHNSSDIKREILDKGGQVRVLVQDPTNEASMAILRQQLDLSNDLDHDLKGALFTLNKMVKWGNVQYRLLPYSPGLSLTIIDPDGRDGRLVVEFFGFHNELIRDRMHIVIERRQSQYWFEYWAKQFEAMWAVAREDAPQETQAG
jgi:hypothetical protein